MAAIDKAISIDVQTSVGICRPGDKLVIATNRILSLAEIEEWSNQIIEFLPGIEVVFIPAAAIILYRPDGH